MNRKGFPLSLDKEETTLPLLVVNGVIYYGRLTFRIESYIEESLMRLRMAPQQIKLLELSK